jgi:hypothetical protein
MSDEPRKSRQPIAARLGRFLFATAKSYVVAVHGASEGAGFRTLARLLRGGPLNWAGLAALLLTVLVTAYLILQGQGFPQLGADLWDGTHVAAPLVALYLSLLVMAIGWAYLLAGAANASLGLYVLVATYVAWHSLMIGRAMTYAYGLVLLWLLTLGAWGAASRPTRWRIPLLLLLSLAVASLSLRLSGLGKVLPRTPATIVLALIYLALVANPWALRPRPFRPAIALLGSLILLVVYFDISLAPSSPDQVFRDTFWDFYDLLGFASLFWYWLGLGLFGSAHDLSDWLLSTTRALFSERVLRRVVFAFWTLWVIIAYLLLRTPPEWVMRPLLHFRAGVALLQAYGSLKLTGPFGLALESHLYITLGALLVALALLAVRGLTHDRLMSLLGLTLFTLFALLGYYGLFYALKVAGTGRPLGLWPAIVFVGGIFWQVLMGSADLISGGRSRPLLFLGFLLVVGAISLLELSAGYQQFEMELTLNALNGVLYLGLPHLLYTHFYQRRRLTPVPTGQLLLLFALGMASAIPCLLAESLVSAPVLWFLIILVTTWRSGKWDEPQDGLVYALTLALGFVVYYTHRVDISIPALVPILGQVGEFQANWELRVFYPWQWEWWWILLQAACAAAVMGYALSRARTTRGGRRVLFLSLALILSSVLLFLCSLAGW